MRLPRLPLMLLANLLPRAERDEVLADIADEYVARVEAFGDATARRWLWRQALGSAAALVRWNWRREWTGFIPAANSYSPGGSMLRSWVADAHYAARRLRARPGYALLAVLALALGVGGTAAAYGVARGVLFESLPFPNEGEVGVFWKKTDWTEEEFLFVRGRVPGFSQVALYRRGDVILRNGDDPAKLLPGVAASAELFDVLGARPLLGRGFTAGDDALGAEPVAVLSYSLWQELGGDSSIAGARLTLNGTPRTVVGVMPRGFWFPDPSVRLWTPVTLSSEARSWNSTLVGRVAPRHDVRAMSDPVSQLTAMLDERFDYAPQWDKTKNPLITPLRDDLLGPMRPAVRATLGTMALILLIACANIAALMLGQVDARASELAVRSALGATRRRLTQQLVLEAVLIAIAAGALGAVLARAGVVMLAGALPLGAWADATARDWSVFATAMAIALAAALLVVLVPTLALWRGDLRRALGGARTGGLEGRGGKMENGLVVAEVALAVLITSGTALLLRSVANLYAVDPGIRTEGVAVVDVTISARLNRDRKQQTIEELTAALAAVPGVQSAAATQELPLRGGGYNLPLEIEGRPELAGLTTEYRVVTPGYLESLGFALRAGRTIAASDGRDAERVVVINEALATKYFAGANPIGQRVGGDIGGFARVIGVVANAVERQLTDVAEPVRYAALGQMPWIDDQQWIVLRAAPGVDETSLLEPARRTIQRVNPTVAVQGTTTMRRVHDVAVGPARQVMTLLALLTALALTLGAVGVYGVIAHFAARRRRDWAIKVALGLPGSRVVANIVRHGALLVGVGIGAGTLAAAALTRLLASMLYGVSVIDPFAYTGAGATLLLVGLIAALIPALRAGKVDPARILREE